MRSSLTSLVPRPITGLVRRRSLIGFRAASQQLWGSAGIEEICSDLPAAVRERTAGLLPLPEWIPLEDLVSWHLAAWRGPARREETVMTHHAQLTVDQGFGRVKRFVISLLSPEGLAARVVPLWRDEYSTGRLDTLSVAAHEVQLALSDHAYVEIPLMRYIISEVYRYVLSMTRAENVTVTHALRDASLVVTLRWQ